MSYGKLVLKQPVESEDYAECSAFVIKAIEQIMQAAMDSGNNKIAGLL